MSDDPSVRAVAEALAAVVSGMGIRATVEVGPGGPGTDLAATVQGDGAEAVVGRAGETIDALQYLLANIATRAAGGTRRRVLLDAAGYRERRAEALRALAVQAADEAVRYGDEIELDAMTPHDRRIVHMALKDRSDVVTRSEGEEPRRRIIVEPAD